MAEARNYSGLRQNRGRGSSHYGDRDLGASNPHEAPLYASPPTMHGGYPGSNIGYQIRHSFDRNEWNNVSSGPMPVPSAPPGHFIRQPPPVMLPSSRGNVRGDPFPGPPRGYIDERVVYRISRGHVSDNCSNENIPLILDLELGDLSHNPHDVIGKKGGASREAHRGKERYSNKTRGNKQPCVLVNTTGQSGAYSEWGYVSDVSIASNSESDTASESDHLPSGGTSTRRTERGRGKWRGRGTRRGGRHGKVGSAAASVGDEAGARRGKRQGGGRPGRGRRDTARRQERDDVFISARDRTGSIDRLSNTHDEVPNTETLDINEKEVFLEILKTYRGSVTSQEIRLRFSEYFDSEVDTLDWFDNKKAYFKVFRNKEDSGKSLITLYQNGLRLCIDYATGKSCLKERCKYLHLCRQYVLNCCTHTACKYNHAINSPQNTACLAAPGKERLIQKLPEDDQIVVIRWSNLQLCERYNSHKKCKDGEFGSCPHIHLCKDYVMRRCDDVLCDKSHDISECREILQKYSIKSLSESLVLRMVLLTPSNLGSARKMGHASGGDFPSFSAAMARSTSIASTDSNTSGYGLSSSNKRAVDDYAREEDKPAGLETGRVDGPLSNQPGPCDENRLFATILKEHDGVVDVGTLICLDLLETLPKDEPTIRHFFHKHHGLFRYFESERGVQNSKVTVHKRGFIMCADFQSKRGCQRDACKAMHICKDFIAGYCADDTCCKHVITDAHNETIVTSLGLDVFEECDLIQLLRCSCLQLCQEHIQSGSCTDYASGSCPYLHMCDKYIRDRCLKPEDECTLGHSWEDPLVKITVSKYFVNPPKFLKKFILIPKTPPKPPEPVLNKLFIHRDEAYICEENLRNVCTRGEDCPNHHCKSPYLWQLLIDGAWCSLGSSDVIEQMYCQPSFALYRDQTELGYANLYFEAMSADLETRDRPCQLRRLATAPSMPGAGGSSFSTLWLWYWQENDDTWVPYGLDNKGPQTDIIEMRYEQRDTIRGMHFTAGEHEYCLDFITMMQTNASTRKERAVRRRPFYVSAHAVANLHYPPGMENHFDSTDIPPTWSPMDTTSSSKPKFEKVELPVYDSSFRMVKSKFLDSLKDKHKYQIKHIYRIQNPDLWKAYSRKIKELSDKNKQGRGSHKLQLFAGSHELQLFHGTDEATVRGICFQNFDPRMHGKNATVYGRGSYFATTAAYSDRYTEKGDGGAATRRHMFLARVAVGAMAVGDSSYKRPPPVDMRKPDGELYDSCVDSLPNPSIYVVFEREQCYPEFLIEYEKCSMGTLTQYPAAASTLRPVPAASTSSTFHYSPSTTAASRQLPSGVSSSSPTAVNPAAVGRTSPPPKAKQKESSCLLQ